MQSYIGFIAFIVLFVLFNRQKTNPAINFITKIQTAVFTQDLSNELSVGDRPGSKNKPKPLTIPVGSISADAARKFPNFSTFSSLWSFFLAGLISMLFCIPFGAMHLSESANMFCPLAIVAIFIVLRFAGMTSSNSERNRKFSFYYSIILSTIFYMIISKTSLYSIDPRPIVYANFNFSKWTIDAVFAFFMMYILYSLCYPMLKNMHVVHSIKNLTLNIAKWDICTRVFQEVMGIKRDLIVGMYNLMPVTAILFVFMRIFLLKYIDNDLYLDIPFVIVECIYAFIYLWLCKLKLRIILTDPYKYLTTFEGKRSNENAKIFTQALNKSLDLIPTYLIALSAYPMVILLCSGLYGISFFMSGLACEISRIVPLFIITSAEIIMSTSKIASFLTKEY